MADPQQILHLADELRDWAPVALYTIRFGIRQAHAIAARFQEHYKHDAPETRKLAADNAADVTQRICAELDRLVEHGEVTEEEIRRNYARPDIAKHVQDLILTASETPDESRHQTLAALVASRLVAPLDSESSILLRMAADQLQYLNAEQLRMLGLAFAALHVNITSNAKYSQDAGSSEEEFAEYLEQVNNAVGPFRDLGPARAVTFMHFEELGLAKLETWSARERMFPSTDFSRSALLEPLSARFYGKMLHSISAPQSIEETLRWVMKLMQGDPDKNIYGVQAVRLTPTGYVVADCMFCVAHGEPFKFHADQL